MRAIIILCCFAAFSIASLVTVSLAAISQSSVTMGLAIAVGEKSTDNLSFAENYSSAANSGKVAAIAAAGPYGSEGMASSYSATANMISVVQTAEESVFVVAFTNGSSADIASKYKYFLDGGLLSSTFGEFHLKSPERFPVFIVSEQTADIKNSTLFSGRGDILIRNAGASLGGQQNITVERVG